VVVFTSEGGISFTLVVDFARFGLVVGGFRLAASLVSVQAANVTTETNRDPTSASILCRERSGRGEGKPVAIT
jgi:hypothetical protein